MDTNLAVALGQYIQRAGYTPIQLARLSGIPKRTVQNWLRGLVKRPRSWEDLIRIARVLHMSKTETTHLLQSAGHPSFEQLLAQADDQQKDLLLPWMGTEQQVTHPPFQAIADFPNFVGREQELQALRKALLNGHQVTLYSFQGMGGVGKTTLATHIAYELRPHFPDGVLWARVDTSDTMSILSTFADAYGRDISTYTDVESRSRVVRGLLADKHALIVLDNVESSEQVIPLLPPSGTCAVIITTRRHDLSVTRAAHKFLISPFSQEQGEALDLFAKMLGADVVKSECATLIEIANLLGHLPLALDIAACRMVYEPGWSRSGFLERLKQEQRRLDELAYEDQNVRLSFNVSYDALSEEQQHFFAALGVFEGEDFDVEAAAYVTETPRQEAEDNLRALYGLSLVQRGRSGVSQRYRLHPLLRDYAREKLQDDGVYERMVTYFVCYTKSHEEEYATLDLERDHIIAALEAAFEREMRAELVEGANAFYPFLDTRGLYALAEVHLSRAERAIRAAGDIPNLMAEHGLAMMQDLAITLHHLGKTSECRGDYDRAKARYQEGLKAAYRSEHEESIRVILQGLGAVAFYRGDYLQAKEFWQQGLAQAREANDRRSEGDFVSNVGLAYYALGQVKAGEDRPGAIQYYEQALDIARQIGDLRGEGRRLGNLGLAYRDLGQAEKAIQCYKQSLYVARQIGDRSCEGNALCNLGIAYNDLGQVEADGDRPGAIQYFEQALDIARQIGDRRNEGLHLSNLGSVYHDLGQVEADGDRPGAIQYYEQALDIARQIGDLRSEGNILCNLGLAYRDLGQVEADGDRPGAIQYCEQALDIARKIGDRGTEGRALSDLGIAYHDLGQVEAGGDRPGAIQYYEQALDIARQIGDRRGEGYRLRSLGLAYLDLGQVKTDGGHPGAIEYYEQALAIAREIGDLACESDCLNGLGLVHRDLQQIEQAIAYCEQALTISREMGLRKAEAEACWSLGLLHEEDDPARAAEFMQVRVDYRRKIGHVDAEADAKRVQELLERARGADTSPHVH